MTVHHATGDRSSRCVAELKPLAARSHTGHSARSGPVPTSFEIHFLMWSMRSRNTHLTGHPPRRLGVMTTLGGLVPPRPTVPRARRSAWHEQRRRRPRAAACWSAHRTRVATHSACAMPVRRGPPHQERHQPSSAPADRRHAAAPRGPSSAFSPLPFLTSSPSRPRSLQPSPPDPSPARRRPSTSLARGPLRRDRAGWGAWPAAGGVSTLLPRRLHDGYTALTRGSRQ